MGINLTSASHIFLLEPVFNPALEAQAIGRAWRMGQTRPVTVKKFFVKDSVEERMLEVAQRRSAGPAAGAAGAELAARKGKVKASEIAGCVGCPALAGCDGGLRGCGRRARDGGGHGAEAVRRALFGRSAIKSDKQDLRLEELEILFKYTAGWEAATERARSSVERRRG